MSSAESHPQLEAYLSEARAWDCDRVAEWQRSVRRAWCVAGVAAACALSSALALALLLPLKRVEPFLIRVDNGSGVVDVVPAYAGRADPGEPVTRYFLTHYILTCERFNYSTAESDYEECGAFHNAQRNQAWYALWSPSNPASPLNLHKDGSTVSAQVESVSFFRRASGMADLAQVRYLKIERAANAVQENISHWIATIQYAYAGPSTDARVRRWNPLGFKILDFVREPEVLREAHEESRARSERVQP